MLKIYYSWLNFVTFSPSERAWQLNFFQFQNWFSYGQKEFFAKKATFRKIIFCYCSIIEKTDNLLSSLSWSMSTNILYLKSLLIPSSIKRILIIRNFKLKKRKFYKLPPIHFCQLSLQHFFIRIRFNFRPKVFLIYLNFLCRFFSSSLSIFHFFFFTVNFSFFLFLLSDNVTPCGLPRTAGMKYSNRIWRYFALGF